MDRRAEGGRVITNSVRRIADLRHPQPAQRLLLDEKAIRGHPGREFPEPQIRRQSAHLQAETVTPILKYMQLGRMVLCAQALEGTQSTVRRAGRIVARNGQEHLWGACRPRMGA